MEAVKNFIYSQLAKGNISRDNAKTLLKEIFEGTGETEKKVKDVAIVGIACKFAGIKNKNEFWDALKNGSCCIGKFPETRRQDTDRYLPLEMKDIEDPYIKAGYINEIDKFDNTFFRIPPKEAELMDPAQRIFLETAWEAIEDAGLGGNRLHGSRTGVYVGKDTSPKTDYKSIITGLDSDIPTGTTTSILASRLAYVLNLKGPCMVIDTACSSGLVSTHLAYQALANGDIDQAIVGGVALLPFPIAGGVVSSVSGKLSAFSKSADGTVWGEGVGVIVLKALDKAMKERDNIYAVIKGSALNNDGASNGLTAPSAESQTEVIKAAWKNSKVNPETITYIEAHGTGTKLGDPIEVRGIQSVFSEYTTKKQFCGIGSVKTNIGHTVGAAGISSVIKMALALKNGQIPPSLNFDAPNQYIDFAQSPIYVVDRLTPWEVQEGPRRCGVSSFGFSGTNCHIVMEEAPIAQAPVADQMKRHIFTLSAKSENSFQSLVEEYAKCFEKGINASLGDICSTANKGRGQYTYRLALIVDSVSDLIRKINIVRKDGLEAASKAMSGIHSGKHFIVLNKEEKKEWELSEEEKMALSLSADNLIEGSVEIDGILEELSSLYIKGADIKWERIYKDGQYSSITLPVYQFDRKRYWVEAENGFAFGAGASRPAERGMEKTIDHPLLDRCVVRSMNEGIYATDFSVSSHWVLNEHTIAGKNAIPGTTYLDMALTAGQEYFGSDITNLRNIQFYSPMVCAGDQIKEVQIVLRRQDEKVTFTTLSCDNPGDSPENEKWTVHSTGEIEPGKRSFINKYEMKELLSEFGEEIEIVRDKKSIMGFGPRWKGIRRARLGDNKAIVYLELQDQIKGDVDQFTLHPALLDIATSIAASSTPGEGFYLPFSYRDVRIYNRIPAKCFSYIKALVSGNTADKEILRYDVEILDEEGMVVVQIKDFALKKVHDVRKRMRELSASDIMYLKQGWNKVDEVLDGDVSASGKIMVFKDSSDYSRNVVDNFRVSGLDIIEVEIGSEFKFIGEGRYEIGNRQEDYDRLFETEKDLSVVLYLYGLKDFTGKDLLSEAEGTDKVDVHSLLFMDKSFVKNNIRNKVRLIFVSKNAYEVTGEERYINPFSSALFNLCKVISNENLNISYKCIDVDDRVNVNDLVKEVMKDNSYSTVAYRGGDRYIQIIEKAISENKEKIDIEIKENGVYLITGGTGGIGLEVCKYLSSRANVKLALINRSKLPDRSEWDSIISNDENTRLARQILKIKQLEQDGSMVECFSADISKEEEVKPIIEKLINEYGRINGVIHSAGVAGDGFLANKDLKEFDKVIYPKLQGALVLDKVIEGYDLDFFMMFSSIESLYASAGQGDYTAANTFLNAYSIYRSKLGKKTVSVVWPAWKEVGMAFDLNAVKDKGLSRALSNTEGINIFEEALSSEQAVMIPIILNYEHLDTSMKEQFPIMISDELWKEVEDRTKQLLRSKSDTKVSKEENITVVITGKDEEDFTEIEVKVAKIWAGVLGLKRIDIYESLHSLGGDSLHSIGILRKIDAQFPGVVDISDIFTYSTVSELAAFIEKKTGVKKETKPEENIEEDIDEVLRKLANNEIEVDEVDKLLKFVGDE